MTVGNLKTKEERKLLQWHPAFFITLQIEFKNESDNLVFENEHQLSSKPLEIDVLIIKKQDEDAIEKNIGKIFRKHNIFEYKGPNDYLSIDDFYKTYGYACFYKADVNKVNSIKIKEITISFVSNGYPRKLMKHLKKIRNYQIHRKYRGIYYVTGDIIPIQFIIQNQLSKQDNLWLKSLTNRLEKQGTIEWLLKDYKENEYSPMYKTAMDMIVRSNQKLFEEVDYYMCQALEELYADKIIARINAKAEAKAVELAETKVAELTEAKVAELAEAKAEELAEARAEELAEAKEARKNLLILKLFELDRVDDIMKVAKDREYQQKLLEEFQL